ncbi:MAG TPA: hypothetical protein VKA46_32380 [Gemmataceae bacterium]|nr:hypothetical protein [Gemmataceae bacterium]
MSVEHLMGKRTGRRPGSKSTPWRKAALWAFRHLNDGDHATPPSEFARRLRDQAREDPAQLLTALALLDGSACVLPAGGDDADEPDPGRRNGQKATDTGASVAPVGGIRKLSVPVVGVINWANNFGEPTWMARVPQSFEILNVVLQRPQRRLILTIRAPSIQPAPPGQEIPVEVCN